MDYKNRTRNLAVKKTSIVSLLSNNFNDEFEDLADDEFKFLKFKELEDTLRNGFILLLQKNINGVIQILIELYQHFLTPNIDLTRDSQVIQLSQFCLFLFENIRDPEFLPVTPFFLQLFIEIIAKDKSTNVIHYCIDHNAVEIIMYLTKNMSEKYYQLIMIFAYDLYSFCADIAANKTTEFYRILLQVFNVMNDEYYSFLSLLALISILRGTKIKDHDLNSKFFQSIVLCVDCDSPMISINAMWCLYFWFKNSWQDASPYIDKDFLRMLSKNIKQSSFEDTVNISLYIYSYCWAISDESKKSNVEKYFPFDEIFSMIKHKSDDISALSFVNLNNFVCDKHSNFTYLLSQKNGFVEILNAFNIQSAKSKIEGGFLILTILDYIPNESLPNFMSNDLILILCELCLIENFDLIVKILSFFINIIDNYPCIIPILRDTDLINEIQTIDDPKINELTGLLSSHIYNIVSQ